MRFNFFIFLVSVFGISACVCDAEIICFGQDELQISAEVVFRDFWEQERDSFQIIVYKSSNDSIVRNYKIGRSIRDRNNTGKHIYDLNFPLNSGDARTQYWVFKSYSFTDTIHSFYYETQDTILSCAGGCNNNYSGTENAIIYNDFYFIHKGDTVRNQESMVIRK